jgi:hypothetical protein
MAAARRSRAAGRGTRASGLSLDDDSCGCVMGARVMFVVLVASSVWYLWLGAQPDRTLAGAILRILGATLAGGVAGKLAGIARYQWRVRAERRRSAQLTDRVVLSD